VLAFEPLGQFDGIHLPSTAPTMMFAIRLDPMRAKVGAFTLAERA
jgi:hypothetical protein